MKVWLRSVGVLIGVMSLSASRLSGTTWFPLGPYGGDARSFAADPSDSKHLFLGSETGWIYDSHDTGATWTRVARLAKSDDLVIDHILVDPSNPKHLLVGAWRIDRPDGGIFISQDAGRTWYQQAQMRGQSVRSMARSASDANVIAAGTLQGVFLTKDGGLHWNQISPAGSTELHEVQSLAIDPVDPNVIYVGTWHLPWKTTDGGATWTNIKQGIIDDSDVFSIILDPAHPDTVYASACSGIYKSLNAGEQFKKIQGIPSTARRTHRLLQDPSHPDTVFAGTTEGLYRTRNAGETFTRTTAADVIINDVYVDPTHPEHVLLATDRGGVLSSEDGGDTFESSNTGFSARQVLAFAADAHDAGTIYVGVVNDKETGGVFQSRDGGVQWAQFSKGLGGRDIFSLTSTTSGTLLAGTAHGIYRMQDGAWGSSSTLEQVPASAAPATVPPPTSEAAPPPARPVQSAQRAASRRRASLKAAVSPTHRAAPHGKLVPARETRGRKPLHPAKKATGTRAVLKKGKGAPRTAANLRRVSAAGHGRAGPPQAQKLQRPRPLRLQEAPAVAQPPSVANSAALDGVVYDLVPAAGTVYAGTSQGLMRSVDDGLTWSAVRALTMPEVRYVAAQKQVVAAAGLKRMALSVDAGSTWDTVALPSELTQVAALAVDELGNVWVGGSEGVFYSTDYGLTWRTLRNLFLRQVDGLYFDAANHRVLVTASGSTITFAAHLPDYKVSFWDSGWYLRFVRPVGDHLIGATMFDGMVLQPKMVAPDEKATETKGRPAEAAPTAAPIGQ